MLTSCSSVSNVKSLLVTEERFTPFVAAGLLLSGFVDGEATWMLTSCSSVKRVKSLLIIEEWFAPFVMAATIPGANHKLAITAPVVI